MNFSYEELYAMYGQYDTFVHLQFKYGTDSFAEFGGKLMGTFSYNLEERRELEKILKFQDIPRTERRVCFHPSTLETLTPTQIEKLDKEGVLCSDIEVVSSINRPRENRFTTYGEKDIPNTLTIRVNDNVSHRDGNRIDFGFLNHRYKNNQPLSPEELNQYWGLRKHFEVEVDHEDFNQMVFDDSGRVCSKIRYYELRAKYRDVTIKDEDLKEFAELFIQRTRERNTIVADEIKKSTERIKFIQSQFGDKIETLEELCIRFEEEVLLFGEKLIYLDFERFAHIYVRHVAETQIGERFVGKTIFQYKFDEINRLIKCVLKVVENEIQEHFQHHPDRNFVRIGKRSVYFDGHYYRVEIECSGRLLTFHSYNVNE